jgi:hypothetical protein
MIESLNPPWIFPRKGEVVMGVRPLLTSFIRVTYDFENMCWKSSQNQPINIYGWIRK